MSHMSRFPACLYNGVLLSEDKRPESIISPLARRVSQSRQAVALLAGCDST